MTANSQSKTGYFDYRLSRLEQVPLDPSDHDDDDRRAVEIAATAVGQLVVVTKNSTITRNRGNLRIPATKLRHESFFGGDDGYPLYQEINFGNDAYTPDPAKDWDLNPYFDEYLIDSFATASVFERRNWIITAYHAIAPRAISEDPGAEKQTYFVFGRNHDSPIAAPKGNRLRIPSSYYRRCRRILKFGNGGAASGNDWAIIELDSDVPNHVHPLRSAEGSGLVKEGVFVLQHPLGLPLKFSQATTKDKDDKDNTAPKVRTDLGAGSSGSPLLRRVGPCAVELFGVIGGGDVDFKAVHLRQTWSGLVIDPSLDERKQVPHPFTQIAGGSGPSAASCLPQPGAQTQQAK